MATNQGTVKKTSLGAFSRPRTAGIIAIDLRDGDRLVNAAITGWRLATYCCRELRQSIRFRESDVRAMGRGRLAFEASGWRAGHEVIALPLCVKVWFLLATENGYGKRTRIEDFPVQGRGGQGVIAIQTTDRNGRTVGALQVRAKRSRAHQFERHPRPHAGR